MKSKFQWITKRWDKLPEKRQELISSLAYLCVVLSFFPIFIIAVSKKETLGDFPELFIKTMLVFFGIFTCLFGGILLWSKGDDLSHHKNSKISALGNILQSSVFVIGIVLFIGALAYDGGKNTFHGDTCKDDCSGHEAGYDWAEDHDITDPDDCGGKSESFIEGCEAYAEEN
jgi:hypothetical protein